MTDNAVLLTWLARDNDPFDRNSTPEDPIDGPTLTLLTDPDSPYRRRVGDVVVFYRDNPHDPTDRRERETTDRLRAEIARRAEVRFHRRPWRHDDPTDYRAILDFLRGEVDTLRETFAGREWVIHISPGTPAMQTVWVLMAASGLIDPPVRVVKSYRRRDRRGRPPVVPVELDIETYFKVYREARASGLDAEGEVQWDPRRFRSARLRDLFDRARRVARLRVPVLLLGERGTGKTTLASWIRSNSPFRKAALDAEWPAIACGQFTGETMRSELLGHTRGAYTGAERERGGLLARADGDTLFLDEIGDLDPTVQRLLIRAVEEQRFVPLGADAAVTSTFRLLTATNRSLDALRAQLHPDFFDRISAFRLTVPPLREIPEDLDWLWESVYATARRRAAVAPSDAALEGLSHAAAVERLRAHPLPGNLRDLLRVAWHLQARRLEGPLGPAEVGAVVDDALDELHGPPRPATGAAIARRWADDAPIDDLVPAGERFATKPAVRALQRWLGEALLTLARRRGVPAAEISDVSDRALRKWRSSEPER